MAWKQNVFTKKLDYYTKFFRGILTVAPSTPQEGWTYINTVTNGYYIYYGDAWQLLHTLALSCLLLETGDYLLLETGGKLGLEL